VGTGLSLQLKLQLNLQSNRTTKKKKGKAHHVTKACTSVPKSSAMVDLVA